MSYNKRKVVTMFSIHRDDYFGYLSPVKRSYPTTDSLLLLKIIKYDISNDKQLSHNLENSPVQVIIESIIGFERSKQRLASLSPYNKDYQELVKLALDKYQLSKHNNVLEVLASKHSSPSSDPPHHMIYINKLRLNRKTSYDQNPLLLPLRPSTSFFRHYADLYYLDTRNWSIVGTKTNINGEDGIDDEDDNNREGFWLKNYQYVFNDYIKPSFINFLRLVQKEIEEIERTKQEDETLFNTKTTKNVNSDLDNDAKIQVINTIDPSSFEINKSKTIQQDKKLKPKEDITIPDMINDPVPIIPSKMNDIGLDDISLSTTAAAIDPEEEVKYDNLNKERKSNKIYIPSALKQSSCTLFNDCIKLVLQYNFEGAKEGEPLPGESLFPLCLLSQIDEWKDLQDQQAWGLALPKNVLSINVKNTLDFIDIPFLEVGKGILLKDVTVGSLSRDPELIVGDMFWNGVNKMKFVKKGWKQTLNVVGNENSPTVVEIENNTPQRCSSLSQLEKIDSKNDVANKDTKNNQLLNGCITGTVETNKWIIIRETLKNISQLTVSFSIPYKPSKNIPTIDPFRNVMWFYHYDFKIGNESMNRYLSINSNGTLLQKTIPTMMQRIFIKPSSGLSRIEYAGIFDNGWSDDDSLFPGDSNNRIKDETESYRVAPSPVTFSARSTARRVHLRSSSNDGDETTAVPSEGDNDRGEYAYGQSSTINSIRQVTLRNALTLSNDTRMRYMVDTVNVVSTIIHYVLITDSELPTLSNAGSQSLKTNWIDTQSFLSVKMMENTGSPSKNVSSMAPISNEPCRLSVYLENGLEFTSIDRHRLSENDSIFVPLNTTDNSVSLTNFVYKQASDINVKTTTLDCRVIFKIRKGTTPGGLLVIYDGDKIIEHMTDKGNKSEGLQTMEDYIKSLNQIDDLSRIAFLNSKFAGRANRIFVKYIDIDKTASKTLSQNKDITKGSFYPKMSMHLRFTQNTSMSIN